MTDRKAIHSELEKFGLSARQADIYLLLVASKELRIQEIVKLSHVPRSTVYEILKQLFRLGLAEESIRDNFKMVRANPLSALKHDLNEQIQQLRSQADRIDKIEEAIDVTAPPPTGPTDVRYYKGRSGARQVIWNTLKTGNTVYVYSEWGRQKYVGMKFYENFAATNSQRNLKEKVLINLNPQILRSIKQYTLSGSPIARTRIEDIRVIDSEQVRIKGDTMIYNDVYAQLYLRNIEIHGFEIQSPDFVETQRSIFETLWQSAKPVSDFLN